MRHKIFITLLLSAAVFTATHNCFAQAKETPARDPAPQAKPEQKAPPAPHDHSHITKTEEDASPARKYFTDVELLNQNGE